MEKQNKAVDGSASADPKGIWIHSEGHAKAHWHVVEGECDCVSCESKPRFIIYPAAA